MFDLIQGETLSEPHWKIGVVTSRFNSPVTEKLETGALERLEELGFSAGQVVRTRVPGAFEIPAAAKWMVDEGAHAVVALGCVIRGETTHYDYVCSAVERGCTELQLSSGCPIGFGVLTTENGEQALSRAGGAKGNKGAEAVDVVIEMLNLKSKLKQSE